MSRNGNARTEILQRIRGANSNAGVGVNTARQTKRGTTSTGLTHDDLVAMFAERVEDYRAIVEHCDSSDVAHRIAAAVRSANGVLIPDGFPASWAAQIPPSARREDPGTAAGLDAIEAVVTTSAVGIARTGTIVLDHTAGQGRRALTLVPDMHLCVVRSDQVMLDVPDAVRTLHAAVDAGQPLTWISGPSATSDIELSRVEGVHGPRRLHVIIAS